jgi:chromosomal replication initiation ATPase DnaA
LKGRSFEKKRYSQVPESLALAPNLDAIKEKVCGYYQVDESELSKSKTGRFNEARSMAIYLARMLQKGVLMEIRSEFVLKGYSSAIRVLAVMEGKIRKSRNLKKRYEQFRDSLQKSQTEACSLSAAGI